MKALTSSLLCLVLIGCNDTRTSPKPVVTSHDGKLGTPVASTGSSTTSGTTDRTHTTDRANTTDHANTADRTNTGVNARDRDSAHKTPIDQNENQADINITAGIRKKVVAEKMSVEAHNVKIITQDGKVTLRGPVKTDDEKQKIEAIANEVAGTDKVDSQLEVSDK